MYFSVQTRHGNVRNGAKNGQELLYPHYCHYRLSGQRFCRVLDLYSRDHVGLSKMQKNEARILSCSFFSDNSQVLLCLNLF